MKIRDPKTGKEWDKLSNASRYFCDETDCENGECVFKGLGVCKCENVCIDEPKKAIAMMGYEIAYDKPRLCEILGVEVNEEFTIDDRNGVFFVDKDGIFFRDKKYIDDGALFHVIEHPEAIRRLPRWTEDDIADAKAIKRLWPRADGIKKLENGVIELYEKGQWVTSLVVRCAILEGCKCNGLVKLEDIIGEETDE